MSFPRTVRKDGHLTVRTRTKVSKGDRTFLDETLTVTPVPTHRPTLTQALLQQRLYQTSETPLNWLSHVVYNLTTYALQTNRYDDYTYLLMSRPLRQTEWQTKSTIQRSNVATARPFTLVRPAETLARDWLNTNERQEMVISETTILNTDKTSNRWVSATCIQYSTGHGHYQRLSLESWFTNLEQMSPTIVVNSYRHRTNDLLTVSSKIDNERIWLSIKDC